MKNTKILIPFISMILFVSNVRAVDSVAKKMDLMLVDLIQLGTYFDNPQRLYAPSSHEKMLHTSQHLLSTFKEASHFNLLKEQSLIPSASILEESLSSIEDSLKDKNLNYAKLRFNSTRSICLSCHTQIDWKAGTDIVQKVNELGYELKLSNVDKGDVYSLVRDYTKSGQYYLSALQLKETKRDATDEISILRKILHNYLTGLVDANAADDFLSVNRSTMGLSRAASLLLDEWIGELRIWSKKEKNLSKMSVDGFIAFYKERDRLIDDAHDGAREVINYLLLGKIGKAMINEPTAKVDRAELLYYLGMADRFVDSNFLYNLSDLYLKECVRNYSKSKYARKCYESYEDSVYQSFSGSAGVFIPADIRAELVELKAILKKN